MHMRMFSTLAITASAALLLAGCASSGSGDMSGMSMQSSSSSAATASSATHNAQDVAFSQGMAAHHLQAVDMANMVLAKTGVDSRVTALARTIKAEQQPEITTMNGWLTSWGVKAVTSSSDMSGMSGDMMSTADMDALKNATGAKASSLFLTEMTTHHQGALKMAATEVSSGKDAASIALAKKITAAQTAQITEMQTLLKKL